MRFVLLRAAAPGASLKTSLRASLRTLLAAIPAALLLCTPLRAETRYVTEQLIVNVYAQPDLAGDRLAQVRSAEAVELLGTEGEAAQIRTTDGVEGWMQASYLETEEPLATRFAALSAESERLRKAQSSTTRVDPKPLQKEIADLRAALDEANRRAAESQAPAQRASPPADEEPVETVRPPRNDAVRSTLLVLLVAAIALGAGFAWGYRTLDKRIRAKYGGLKVY